MVGRELRHGGRRAARCCAAGITALLAAAAVAAPALAADDLEPNDSQAQATRMQPGKSYEAKVSRLDDAVNQRPGDVDWYLLDAAAGPIDIAYTALQEQGSCFGPEARLFDGTGATLGTAQPPKGKTDHIRFDAAADGVLYLRVQQYQIESCDAPIPYRLRADFTAASGGGGIEGLAITAKKTQKQRGKRIRVKVRINAAEPIEAAAKGRVKVGKRRLKLSAAAAAGRELALVLRAKGKSGRRIAAAIADGKRVVAKVDLAIADGDGNTRTKRLQIRLR